MKDYSMDLTMIAAGIIKDCLGDGLTSSIYYSANGNSIIIEFDGYPLSGSDCTGKVYVEFPRDTFYVKRCNVCYKPISQSQCRYYQENIGNQFAHPHIYNDGHPSWDNSKRERPVDFIANIIETFSLQNVTKESITYGLCSSGIMGVGMESLKNAQEQQIRVLEVLNCKPFIADHRKLKGYVNRSWCDKITSLLNSGNFRKIVFENVTGVSVSAYIDMEDSPQKIVQEFCKSDPKAAVCFFSNRLSMDYFMQGYFSEFYRSRSIFDLIDLEGNSFPVNWDNALWDQLAIREKMIHIEREGQVATFVVHIGPGFA